MRTTTKIILCLALDLLGCTIVDDPDLEARSAKSDAFDSDADACDADTIVQPGEGTAQYKVISTTEIALLDKADGYTLDPKTGVVYLQDGVTGFQCRCGTGCSEATACEASGGSTELRCDGWCAGGTDNDGNDCGHCSWHTTQVPSPGGDAGGALDPTGATGGKPPGTDPTAGSVDPTG